MTKRKCKSIRERMEGKYLVHPVTRCWVWTSGRDPQGYGRMRKGRATDGHMFAHRASWEAHHGEIPEGLHVLHHCDNPGCVSPDHIYLGTNDDNIRDKMARSRQARGENAGGAKLSEGQALAIIADPRKQIEIARDYGVQPNTISRIKSGSRWGHLS